MDSALADSRMRRWMASGEAWAAAAAWGEIWAVLLVEEGSFVVGVPKMCVPRMMPVRKIWRV